MLPNLEPFPASRRSAASLAIVIPSCNCAAHLPACIASCFEAGAGADMVVVVDDASTDTTTAVLETLCQRFPRLIVISHSTRRGIAASIQTGLKAAGQCDWVMVRSPGTHFPCGSIASFRRTVRQFPDAGLITGDIVHFARIASEGTRERAGRALAPVAIDCDTFVERFGGNCLHSNSTFCRSEWIHASGGPELAMGRHALWYLWVSIGLSRGFAYAPEVFGAQQIETAAEPPSTDPSLCDIEPSPAEILPRLLDNLSANPVLSERILKTGCLSYFGPALKDLVAQGPTELQSRFKSLLEPPSPDLAAAQLATGPAVVFREFLTSHRDVLERHIGQTLLLGASDETSALVSEWHSSGLPLPALAIDEQAGDRPSELHGIPVRRPPAIAAFDSPLIVLPSRRNEEAMAVFLDALFPGVPYLRIWGADANKPAPHR